MFYLNFTMHWFLLRSFIWDLNDKISILKIGNGIKEWKIKLSQLHHLASFRRVLPVINVFHQCPTH